MEWFPHCLFHMLLRIAVHSYCMINDEPNVAEIAHCNYMPMMHQHITLVVVLMIFSNGLYVKLP